LPDMKSWSHGRCQGAGVSLHYFRSGGDLPPLVLVHGFTDNARYFTRLAEALSAAWDVVAYDARGHGQSDRANGAFNDTLRVADLVAVVSQLELDRPAMLGHSMGAATIALAVAATPSLSRGIVLEDPAWWEIPPMKDEDVVALGKARLERNAKWRDDITEVQAMSREDGLAWRRKDGGANWSEQDVALSLDSRYDVELDLFTYYPQEEAPWKSSVAAWRCPSLLVLGDQSLGAIISAEQADEASALNANLQYVRIEGAGHAVRYDQFDRYIAAVRPFLTGVAS
jgi:N-formylmaleamate deformylase